MDLKNTKCPGKEHVGLNVTLDGKPARVIGRKNTFATIAQYPDGISAVYSWETVDRIVKNGGKFRSGSI